jgi:hypothetical protein
MRCFLLLMLMVAVLVTGFLMLGTPSSEASSHVLPESSYVKAEAWANNAANHSCPNGHCDWRQHEQSQPKVQVEVTQAEQPAHHDPLWVVAMLACLGLAIGIGVQLWARFNTTV